MKEFLNYLASPRAEKYLKENKRVFENIDESKILEERVSYNLYLKTRKFREDTLASIYFKSNKKIQKKSCPFDYNGERFKLDLETGELRRYTKQECQKIAYCSVERTKILLNMLLEMNDFDWFCTLTFDKTRIERTNDLQVYNAYKKYINNIKKQFPSFKYITVPERHEDLCIHFHLLIGGLTTKQLGLENSGKVCCSWAKWKNGVCSLEYFNKTKSEHTLTETDGLPVYNVTTFPYGFTTVTRIANRQRCNSYVKKYIEKALGSTDIFKKRFFYSSNLDVPNIVKTLIGEDFKSPKRITDLQYTRDNILRQQASYENYNEDFNTLQFWFKNEIKENLDKGLIEIEDDLPF